MMNTEEYKIDPKMRKQEVERKRRLRMTTALDKLKEIMQLETGADFRKADKVEVLESTVKFLKSKHRTEQEESFTAGYNSCLVEISGQLMAATDIDLKSKSILLTFISRLSSSKHVSHDNKQVKCETKTKVVNNVQLSTKKCEQNQPDTPSTSTMRSPLSNIKNVSTASKQETSNEIKTVQDKRGMKRSRSHSACEKENPKKSRIEFNAQDKPIVRPQIKGRYSIENTNIAVIQKNSEGKYTEVSNIPLMALLKNLHNSKNNEKIKNNESKANRRSTTNNKQPINNLEGTETKQTSPGFSYMRLLQEENIDLELLKSTSESSASVIVNSSNINRPTVPFRNQKIITLPPLSSFLNEGE